VSYLLLDTTRPPFDDVRARRAVNFAVDRDRVTRLEAGSNTPRPTCQVLPPNVPGYEPYCPYTLDPAAGSGWRAPDVAKAKGLLAETETKGAAITLWWHTHFGVRTGRYLERLLDSLGYRTQLRMFSGDIGKYFTSLEALGAGWHVAPAGWEADYPAASNFVNLLSCASAYNWGRFCDGGIDARIRRALGLQEEDPVGASEAWAAIDRDLTDRAPWVSLYTPYAGDLVSKRVGNYQYHPVWGAPLSQLWVR
jgi:peptide/nickel transport system substrate-binding protein